MDVLVIGAMFSGAYLLSRVTPASRVVLRRPHVCCWLCKRYFKGPREFGRFIQTCETCEIDNLVDFHPHQPAQFSGQMPPIPLPPEDAPTRKSYDHSKDPAAYQS